MSLACNIYSDVIINFISRLIVIYLLINSCEKSILSIYQHLKIKNIQYYIEEVNSNNSALCRIFIICSVFIAIGHRSH